MAERERADVRVARLLGIVSFVSRHGQATVGELAKQFGVSTEEIDADVNLLWCSGVPGTAGFNRAHGELIDFDFDSYEQGIVKITESQGMQRPLRLGPREAIALEAALRALHAMAQAVADDEDSAVIAATLAKIRLASGVRTDAVDIAFGYGADPAALAQVARARQQGTVLEYDYTDNSDKTTARRGVPVAIETGDGHSYVIAYDTQIAALRTFRLDRMDNITEGGPASPDERAAASAAVDADAPAHGRQTALQAGGHDDHDDVVRLRVLSRARSFVDQLPLDDLTTNEDGTVSVSLRVRNRGWLRSLVLSLAPWVVSVETEGSLDEVVADAALDATKALAAYRSAGLAM